MHPQLSHQLYYLKVHWKQLMDHSAWMNTTWLPTCPPLISLLNSYIKHQHSVKLAPTKIQEFFSTIYNAKWSTNIGNLAFPWRLTQQAHHNIRHKIHDGRIASNSTQLTSLNHHNQPATYLVHIQNGQSVPEIAFIPTNCNEKTSFRFYSLWWCCSWNIEMPFRFFAIHLWGIHSIFEEKNQH